MSRPDETDPFLGSPVKAVALRNLRIVGLGGHNFQLERSGGPCGVVAQTALFCDHSPRLLGVRTGLDQYPAEAPDSANAPALNV